MTLSEFIAFHRSKLEEDELRHNVMLSVFNYAERTPNCKVRFWPLGPAGACAVQQAGYGVVLGDVDRAQAAALAEAVKDDAIPSAIGADQTVHWFVEAATKLGCDYPVEKPELIYSLDRAPSSRDVPGRFRLANSADQDLVLDWMNTFVDEALPFGQAVTSIDVAKRIKADKVFLWCDNERPVSMSCVGRTLENGAAIAPVYTVPSERCKGYAAAATAAVANAIFKRNYRYAFLYTDANNPASNRCYANIGFRQHCRSTHVFRNAPRD